MDAGATRWRPADTCPVHPEADRSIAKTIACPPPTSSLALRNPCVPAARPPSWLAAYLTVSWRLRSSATELASPCRPACPMPGRLINAGAATCRLANPPTSLLVSSWFSREQRLARPAAYDLRAPSASAVEHMCMLAVPLSGPLVRSKHGTLTSSQASSQVRQHPLSLRVPDAYKAYRRGRSAPRTS